MGNQISLVPTQIFSVEEYFTELQEFEFLEKMGSTRFLKIARARLVICLICMIQQTFDLGSSFTKRVNPTLSRHS